MENLVKALQLAASQNIQEVKAAEEQLKQWETTAGFYPKLLEIFAMRHLEVNIRWIAIICLKNGIDKYWRRVVKNCLPDDEKNFIKQNIMIFDEVTPELALQLSVVIGRIARNDIKIWPQCLEVTIEAIKSTNSINQHRGLLTLKQIVKELASKRLASDRRVFHEISSKIFEFLVELCYSSVGRLQAGSIQEVDLCLLVTKVLRRLLIYGGKLYDENTPQIRYVKWCVTQVPVFVELRNKNTEKRPKLHKYVLLLMKILTEFEEHQSGSMLPILHDMLQLCLHYILSNRNDCQEDSMLVIYCGNLLRSASRTFTKLIEPNPCTDVLLNTITVDNLKSLAYYVVMNYLPLTQTERDEWEHDPEAYVNTEAGESHKFLLRPCMETFYVGLFYGFKEHMVPFVVQLVKEASENFNLESITHEDLLKLCAIYKAVGLSSYELFGEIDFDAWFTGHLLNVFNLPSDRYAILQQHVIWMVGEWIDVKLSKPNRIHLYRLLSVILESEHADLVLKLTACKTLRIALDDFDFVLDDFLGFVEKVFPALCSLLIRVEECDTKMMVLNVISLTIQRSGNEVHRHAQMLIQYLPQLWELSDSHNLLRGAVVNLLHHLVKGLAGESSKINHITIPVLNHSTDVNQPAHIYLLEDGLELWQAVISNAPTLNPDLLALYGNLFALLERASETLESCLAITRSYILIDCQTFLQEYGVKLSQCFHELAQNMKETGTLSIVAVFKVISQVQPSAFFNSFQVSILDIFDASLKDENYPILMSQYFTILAYLVVSQPESLFQVGRSYCELNASMGSSYEELMGRLFDVWFEKMDCMSLEDKKVSAIAFASLLPLKISFIGERFALMLDSCVNVLYELQRGDGEDEQPSQDSLVIDWANESIDPNEPQSYESIREKKMMSQDCVYNFHLLPYLKEKLQQTKSAYGEQLFNEAMSTLDSAVAKQLMTLIS